jgi:hypothetical protein
MIRVPVEVDMPLIQPCLCLIPPPQVGVSQTLLLCA